MKFKITKLHAKLLAGSFKESDEEFKEVELEPVCDTAREALLLETIKTEYFEKGYERGLIEGKLRQAEVERYLRMGIYKTKCPCSCYQRGLKFCSC